MDPTPPTKFGYQHQKLMSLLNLPNELLLQCAEILQLPELYHLIQTCHHLALLLTPSLRNRACDDVRKLKNAFYRAAAAGNKASVQLFLHHINQLGLGSVVQRSTEGWISVEETPEKSVAAFVVEQGANVVVNWPIQKNSRSNSPRPSWELSAPISGVETYRRFAQFCALHWAVETQDTKLLTVLLDQGANTSYPYAEDWNPQRHYSWDWGPLHQATENADIETMKVLLERGYDVNTLDYEHKTALRIAVTPEEEPKVEMIRLLLAYGANVNTQNSQGIMVFHEWIAIYYTEIAELFIEHGASLHATSKPGNNALHLAASWGCAETVSLLLQHGDADYCYSRNRFRHTPLHLATTSRNVKVIKVFLDHGVCVHVKDHEGATPLTLAMKYSQHMAECQTLVNLFKDHVCVRKSSVEVPGICI